VYLNNGNYNGFLQNPGTLWWKEFGPPSGGPNWSGSHIFNLVSLTDVYAGDDVTRLSRTEYQYDGPNLINNPGIVQHNHWYNPYTPPQEVCDSYPDPNDPDCNGQCGPCPEEPCPEYPPECDGNCNQIPFCNYIPQYDPKTQYRGNVTQIKSYADAVNLVQGTAVVETWTYDVADNLRVQSSSCCEQTPITCTTATRYAWPESQISGSPSDQNKQNTSSATYDYNTGLIITSTDANGRVSNTEYAPATLRPVRENLPTDAYLSHVYDDLNLKVEDHVYEAGPSGPILASRSDKYLDGLGRVVKEVAFAKNNMRDVVEAKFDNLGRVSQQTRPYRANSDLAPQETLQWSAVTYDSLNRPIQTTSPDGSIVTRAYNQSPDPPGASGQPGDTMKVTDPWGRERWARSDALGRLVEVAEPDPGGNGSLSSGAMYTAYSHDALGRLLQVNQGAQTRSFKYDSLGRLTHQKLAEREASLNDGGQWVGSGVWSDVFTYDKRSNLTQRVDARGVKTIFKYKDGGGNDDPLNRLLEVQYDKSGSPAHLSANIPDSPNVSYGYMTAGDKMRAENVSVANGMGNEQLSYDTEGRLSQVRQTFTGRESYPLFTNYLWDSLGRLKESAYPQQYGAGEIRKIVEPVYDIASRMDSVKFGGTTYASNPVYNASGQTTSLAVGSQITESYNFDPKTGLLLSQQINKGAEQLAHLQYNYTLNNDPNNNGAKTGQLTLVTDLKNTARNRAYEYDKLGRLGKVKGGVDAFSNPAWYQSYTYDRYGNRTGVTKTGAAPQIPLDGLASLSFNTANNRINTAGFEYDPAGNQTRAVINDSGTQQQYRYDCAGRLAQVLDGAGSVLATHSYGASNQRLVSVEGGMTKFFAWAGGQIIAEYEASGANALVWKTSYVYLGRRLLATTSGAGGTETRFHHPDQLGTRLVTDAGGTVVSEQWTLPFGNMQPFTSVPGGESPYQHPTLGNPSKKRFTSYDRSDVTGLDDAVNRFYSPQQGRFTQVDPIGMGAASLTDPQTLNMYAYCGNDPINNVDPDGLFFGKLFRWIGKALKWIAIAAIVAVAVIAHVFPGTWIANLAIWSSKHSFLSAILGINTPNFTIVHLAAIGTGSGVIASGIGTYVGCVPPV
jgi:RHS repeat-associated protein